MKQKLAFLLAALMATGALAQSSAPPLPGPGDASPAPATPPPVMETPTGTKPAAKPKSTKPAAKPAKAAAKKPVAPEAPGAPFMSNDVAVAKQNNINVRAQSHINSEIVAKLKEGQEVTAMKEVTLSKPKTDEPARWVQIALPEGSHAWVSSSYVSGGQVSSTKLNVRSGAGENYSVIGLLHKGDSVKVVSTKGEWTEIEAPAGSFGFVAAHLLAHKQAAPPPPPVVTTMVNPPPSAPIANAGDVTPRPAPPVAMPVIPAPAPAPEPRTITETPPIRIVQREGTVGSTVSIQAPTYFHLQSLDNGKVIDYLYSTSTNLVLDRWMGRKVIVQGEESLDERWPNTPVLTIQKIQVLNDK